VRRKIVPLLLLSIVLLACTCSVPSILPAIKTPTAIAPTTYITPTELPTLVADTLVVEPPTATATAVTIMTIIRLHPQDGSLKEQINAEVPKAAALGQKMFVEFDALW
jgi:hypothetical protein